jgi:hypothetical protein
MNEFWKSIQSKLAYDWFYDQFKSNSSERIEYSHTRTYSASVHGMAKTPLNKPSTRKCLYSVPFTILSVGVVVLTQIALRSFQFELYRSFDEDGGWFVYFIKQTPYTINALLIITYGWIYKSVNITLNRWENHNTDEEYDASLINKACCFDFFNCYFSVVFTGFVSNSFHLVSLNIIN